MEDVKRPLFIGGSRYGADQGEHCQVFAPFEGGPLSSGRTKFIIPE